jgi:SAM-dependent methyltransferase
MPSVSPSHLVFDRALVRARLVRATAAWPYPDFLLRRAADELSERLSAILRDFSIAVDIGTPGPQAAQMLSRQPRIGQVYRAAPVAQVLGRGGFASLIADEEALPFAAASLSLVVSAMALHLVNDLPGTLVQIRQSLRPDGLFIGCLLGGRTLQELRFALATAEAEILGGTSPRVAPFADLRHLGGLLQRAGFALPVSDSDLVTVRYGSMFALIDDLRAMGLANSLSQRSRKPLRRSVLARAADLYSQRFSDRDERVRATFEMLWLAGWAPHESQQIALRPGSAKMRLADALNVRQPEKTPK